MILNEIDGLGRIILVPVSPDDTRLLCWAMEDVVAGNLSFFEKPLTEDRQREWLTRIAKSKTDFVFAILLKGSPRKTIGTIGMHEYDAANHNARLGIMIFSEENKKRGYGTEAIELLLDYVFSDFGMHKVYVRTLCKSEWKMEYFKKLGFVFEGVMREEYFLDGAYHDMDSLGLLKSEWEEMGRKGK